MREDAPYSASPMAELLRSTVRHFVACLFSARICLLAAICSAMAFAFPCQADAQRYLASQDSFISAARQQAPDSTLVPGGIVRSYFNTIGSIGIRGIGTDTLNQLSILLVKSAGAVPFSNIFDTISVYVDANNSGFYETSDAVLVGNMSAGTFGNDTAIYTLGGASQVLRQIGASTESYVIVARTRNDLNLADTRFQVRFKVGQAGQLWTDGLFNYSSLPEDSDKYFPEFSFKVYSDSTANIRQASYTNYVLHDTSVPGWKAITLFEGRLYSETRTVGGDSLSRIGVHFGGTAGADVDSAWAVIGSSERWVDLVRMSGSHWGAVSITKIPLGLSGNGWDTFRIVGIVDSPALLSWVACTIPIDSIATRFRRGNAAVIDSSGLTLFTRPRVVVTDSAMGPVAMHPDSRVNYHVLLESFAINADTLLLKPLTHDSITMLGFAIRMTGTMRYTDIDTVQVVIGNTRTFQATPLVAGYTLPDSWRVVLNEAFTGTTTVQVYVRLRETAPVDATFRFVLHPDSLTTRFRQAGPSSKVVGTRVVTVNKPRVAVTDSAMSNIAVHPDSRVNYHVLLESFAINADTLLTSQMIDDTVASLGFAIQLTGGMRSADIDTVQVVVANSTSVLAVLQPAGTGLPDSWLAKLSSVAFKGTASIQVFVRLRETAPVDATLRFFLPTDSISTRFRLAGPSEHLLGSRVITVRDSQSTNIDTSGPNIWYVNDTSTVGDSWCTAVGHDSNSGLSPGSPLLSVELAAERLSFGDILYIDSGLYIPTRGILIGESQVLVAGRDSASTRINFNSTSGLRLLSVSNCSSVTLRNLRVQSGGGVHFSNTDSCYIADIYVDTSVGLKIDGNSRGNVIDSVYAALNAGVGIYVEASGSVIRNSIALANAGTGISVIGTRNLVRSCRSDSNGWHPAGIVNAHGISVNGQHNQVESCYARFNRYAGIDASSSYDSIIGVEAYGNLIGIHHHGIGALIAGCATHANIYDGIYLAGSSALVACNTSDSNSRDGIFMGSATNNVLTGNKMLRSGRHGIYLYNARGNTVMRNAMLQNRMYDVYIEGSFGGPGFDFSRDDTFLYNRFTRLDDSVVMNSSPYVFDFRRNYWGVNDSSAILRKVGFNSYIRYAPFRLSPPDTSCSSGVDTVAPRAPDTVVAVSLSGSASRISWAPVVDDEELDTYPTNLAFYRVWKASRADSSFWVPIGTVPAGTLSFLDSGLAVGETRYYRVTSVDNWPNYPNESWYSDSIAVVRIDSGSLDSVPPSLPSGLSPANGFETTSGSMRFSWFSSTDSQSGVEGYRVQVVRRADSPALFYDTWVGNVTAVSLALPFIDTYSWRVLSRDYAGNSDTSAPWLTLVRAHAPPRLVFNAWTDTVLVVGQTLVLRLGLADSTGLLPRFSLSGTAPSAFLSFDTVSGILTLTPLPGSGGVYSLVFRGWDGHDTAIDTFRVTVLEANESLSILAGPASLRAGDTVGARVSVLLRDAIEGAVAGWRVTVAGSRPGFDTVTPASAYTDTYGRASFTLVSATPGTTVVSATIDSTGRRLAQTLTVTVRASRDWYVSPSGNNAHDGRSPSTPLRTIAYAVDTASPGDVIHLLSGTYAEGPVAVRSGLTIRGVSAESVVVGPGSNSVGFSFNGVSDAALERVTIASSSQGVKIINGTRIAIRGNRIRDNRSTGIWIQNSAAVSVLNNVLENPGAERNATGLFARNSAGLCVVSNTVRDHRLGGIILVRTDSSHVSANAVSLDSVPGVGQPPFNKASLIVHGTANTVVTNNIVNATPNRSQLNIADQAVVSDNFELLGTPPVALDEPGYRTVPNDTGIAYCDVDGDGVPDNGRTLLVVGAFGTANPFAPAVVPNARPVVDRIRVNGETEGTAVVFDTRAYVIGWRFTDADADSQASVHVTVARDSAFQGVLFDALRYQAAETMAVAMKPRGDFFVRVVVHDGKNWSESAVARFTATDTPAPPRGVTAVGGAFNVLVSWMPNLEEDLGGYRVYRSSTAGGTYTLVATVSKADSRQFLDRPAPAGETRYYVVTAWNTDSPVKESVRSAVCSGAAVNPITGITIDGKFTGWSEYGINEWEQVGAQVTPGRLSKVYVYSDSHCFYIGVDFLQTAFIERIKNDPVLWDWYQRNKSAIFNYFEFKDRAIVDYRDPNVRARRSGSIISYEYTSPIDRVTYPLTARGGGVERTYIFQNQNPAAFEFSYERVSFIRVFGDGKFEVSPNFRASTAKGATGEGPSPNDSSMHRVYEICVPLSLMSAGASARFDRFRFAVSDWDFPGIERFRNMPLVGQAAGQAGGLEAGRRASAFQAAAERLEALDPRTSLSLASSLQAARGFNDADVNALLPVGYVWYDGEASINPQGTVGTDPDEWGAETTPIEAAFTYNTPPVAQVARETILVSPGAQVTLDGSLSADSETSELSYLWLQTAGSALTISDSRSATPVLIVPSSTSETQFVVELTVSDRIFNSLSVPVTLSTVQGNSRPTARVSTPYAVAAVGETVTLAGTGTDPNGDAISFAWSIVSGGPIRGQMIGESVVRFVPASPGRYVLRFSVTDSASLHAIETAVVFVAETIPVLSTSASSALFETRLVGESAVAMYRLAGTGELTARCILGYGSETTEVRVVVDLANGQQNSFLVIGRADSSTLRRGIEKAGQFDTFARFLVELNLLSASGANIGATPGVFDSLELWYEPPRAAIGADILSRLRIFTFDEVKGEWTEVSGVSRTEVGDRVRLRVPLSHFSFYTLAVGVAAATNLSAATVYPNPWVPGDADATNGVEYQAGVANTGITFENLPAGTDLKIYTPLGELVAEWIVDASGGTQWDARNRRGERVASGVYIYLMKSPNGERKTGKLAIVR